MRNLSIYQQIQSQDGADPLERHAGLVKQVALHLSARLPASVDVNELIQVGMIGLLDAQRNFDPTKGVQFEAFARPRVRGAMLDEIRRFSTLPRSVMSSIRNIGQARAELEQQLGRPVRDLELARHMGITREELQKNLARNHDMQTVSLEDEADIEFISPLPSDRPSDEVGKQAFKMALANAIAQLPERDKLLFSLYYDEELNLKEIALVLGVSESRVSQIHSQGVKQLKKKLSDWI